MKALGCNAYVEPDVMAKGFQKEDILVICSDGLTNMVNIEDVNKIVKANFELATRELIDLANQNGGIDNITIITIKNL
jgi:protein phosphatase